MKFIQTKIADDLIKCMDTVTLAKDLKGYVDFVNNISERVDYEELMKVGLTVYEAYYIKNILHRCARIELSLNKRLVMQTVSLYCSQIYNMLNYLCSIGGNNTMFSSNWLYEYCNQYKYDTYVFKSGSLSCYLVRFTQPVYIEYLKLECQLQKFPKSFSYALIDLQYDLYTTAFMAYTRTGIQVASGNYADYAIDTNILFGLE